MKNKFEFEVKIDPELFAELYHAAATTGGDITLILHSSVEGQPLGQMSLPFEKAEPVYRSTT